MIPSIFDHATNDAAVNRLRKTLRRETLPDRPALPAPEGPPPLRERLRRLAERGERTAPEGREP